ncbi:hypothetical protein J6590_015400 [Homalodisca vitripennis]|nr:hypothetical protein J6590_015400 [Homalodisca vitripennis]
MTGCLVSVSFNPCSRPSSVVKRWVVPLVSEALRMAPNVTGSPTSLFLAGAEVISPQKTVQESPVATAANVRPPGAVGKPQGEYHWNIVWRNVIAFAYLHSVSLYTLFQVFTFRIQPLTWLFRNETSALAIQNFEAFMTSRKQGSEAGTWRYSEKGSPHRKTRPFAHYFLAYCQNKDILTISPSFPPRPPESGGAALHTCACYHILYITSCTSHYAAVLHMNCTCKLSSPDVSSTRVFLAKRNLFAVKVVSEVAMTSVTVVLFGNICGLGITAGAHRLWAHKSYKAKWPLRVVLAFMQTVAFQNHIYEWVRDHRVHHKFTDTNADPHNSRRGFFFSHIGWLMVRKHEDVFIKGKTVDMSDLEEDWVVVWQRRLYPILLPICCFVIPTLIPMYFWGENFWTSWNVCVTRYTVSLNMTWLVNSAAHIWGMKPYDRNISPTENISVAVLALGEGWHNYHHAFPWDYKAAELGDYGFNFTTLFLDLCSKLGLAYDLKMASEELVRRRILRSGDGTHSISQEHSHEGEVWGWGDKDMEDDEKRLVARVNPDKEE